MCAKFIAMRGTSTQNQTQTTEQEKKKSPQYYRAVVYNETIENSANLVADGQQMLKSLDYSDKFKSSIFMSQFEED